MQLGVGGTRGTRPAEPPAARLRQALHPRALPQQHPGQPQPLQLRGSAWAPRTPPAPPQLGEACSSPEGCGSHHWPWLWHSPGWHGSRGNHLVLTGKQLGTPEESSCNLVLINVQLLKVNLLNLRLCPAPPFQSLLSSRIRSTDLLRSHSR